MKHVYDPKEYPYGNRKDGTYYEFSPKEIESLNNDPLYSQNYAQAVAHNVREAYPSLAIAAVRVKVPLTLEVTVEGSRLSTMDAHLTAMSYVSNELIPGYRNVRAYSSVLKEETGLTLRDVHLIVGYGKVHEPLTVSEVAAAWDAARVK